MTDHLFLYTLVNAQGLGKELSYLDQSYLALKQLGVILGGIHSSVLDRISYLNCPNVPGNSMNIHAIPWDIRAIEVTNPV